MVSSTSPPVPKEPPTAFLKARDLYLKFFPETEKLQLLQCNDSAALLSSVRVLLEPSPSQVARLSDQCLITVDSFSKKLEHYFEIVSILVSSNPQFTAIA